MFDNQYYFKGRHAYRVIFLTSIFEERNKASLFDTNIQLYINAPLIGFLYNRTADVDNLKNPDTNKVYETSIFKETIDLHRDELMFNFRLILLLDKEYEQDEEKRIDKAFRYIGKDPKDAEHFESYVRGGIDVLYEKLIEEANYTAEDHVIALYNFIEDFHDKFYKNVSNEAILTLCSS